MEFVSTPTLKSLLIDEENMFTPSNLSNVHFHVSQNHFMETFPVALGVSAITGFDWSNIDQSLLDHTESKNIEVQAHEGELVKFAVFLVIQHCHEML